MASQAEAATEAAGGDTFRHRIGQAGRDATDPTRGFRPLLPLVHRIDFLQQERCREEERCRERSVRGMYPALPNSADPVAKGEPWR